MRYKPRFLLLLLFLFFTHLAIADDFEWTHSTPSSDEAPKKLYGRSRSYDLIREKLDLDVDLKTQTIDGKATLEFVPFGEYSTSLSLDAIDFEIRKVTVNGAEASFTGADERILVQIPSNMNTKKSFTVEVFYRVQPERGMIFKAPTKADPKRPYQAWTQGESEYSRYWFPTYDYPNDKAQTEVVVRVDPEFTAISNGKLVDTKVVGSKRQFHYKQEVPHSTYLVSLVIGKFAVLEEKHKSLPLSYYVPPEKKDVIQNSFGRTPAMVDFFENWIGKPYPYEKYAQVVVDEFESGGMENTTATTLFDLVTYPKDQSEDWKAGMDSLLAHELVHQWFGNLVTCSSWAHLWLNEGFATYFANLAMESLSNRDEFSYNMFLMGERAIDSGNTRPTSTNEFESSNDIFDTAVYQRGAWILHALRKKLGDAAFQRGIRLYVERFAGKNAETEDLKKALQEVSGQDLTMLFDQWVYHGGWPVLKAKWSWDEPTQSAVVEISQEPIAGEKDEYYDLEIPVEFAMGTRIEKQIFTLNRKEAETAFRLSQKPTTVRIDPEQTFLKTIDFPRSLDELRFDSGQGMPMLVRLDASRTLRKQVSKKGAGLLGQVLRGDPFWGVRRTAAGSLAMLNHTAAFDELLRSVGSEASSKVRASIVKALAKDDRASTFSTLQSLYSGEKSESVRAEIVNVLAKEKRAEAFTFLEKEADRPSHGHAIQTALLRGFGRSQWDKGLDLAIEKSKPGNPLPIREAAIRAMADIGSELKSKTQVRKLLETYSRDPKLPIRETTLSAMGDLKERGLIPLLRNLSQSAALPRERTRAKRELEKLKESESQPDAQKKLGELEETVEKLKSRLDVLEKEDKKK